MKAAVYYETGGPEVFRFEDVPDPVCPPDGVVIEVAVVSVEGGDVGHRARGEMPARPHVVGYQCAGTIVEAGPEVRDRAVGQRAVAVMMHGSHAEKVAVAAAQTWVVPEGADLERAACVPIAVGTADDCLFEFGHLRAGESVLVQAAAGGVGMAAVQLAKRAGATVLGTASSEAKLARLAQLGLDHGIDYRTRDFVAAVREATGGRGVDLVVDSVGGRTLARSLEALAYRGRVTFVGSTAREPDTVDAAALRPRNLTLTGVFFGAELAIHHERVHAMVARHIADAASGALHIAIDRRFPLAEAAAAHAYIESRRAVGRVLLLP